MDTMEQPRWGTDAEPLEPDDAYPRAARVILEWLSTTPQGQLRERLYMAMAAAITGNCSHEAHVYLQQVEYDAIQAGY